LGISTQMRVVERPKTEYPWWRISRQKNLTHYYLRQHIRTLN
jgi:hypothetical protein